MFPALSVTVTVCVEVDIRTNAMIRFPAVLLPGNAAASEATEVPCTAFDCDSATPPPAPELITMLSAWVAVCEL